MIHPAYHISVYGTTHVRISQLRFLSDPFLLGLNYLVKIDKQGKLRWTKDDHLVDTTAGQGKDDGHGGGIVPVKSPGEELAPTTTERRMSFSDQPPSVSRPSPSSGSSAGSGELASHYNEPIKGNIITKPVKRNLTLRGAMDKLLKRTTKKNT